MNILARIAWRQDQSDNVEVKVNVEAKLAVTVRCRSTRRFKGESVRKGAIQQHLSITKFVSGESEVDSRLLVCGSKCN